MKPLLVGWLILETGGESRKNGKIWGVQAALWINPSHVFYFIPVASGQRCSFIALEQIAAHLRPQSASRAMSYVGSASVHECGNDDYIKAKSYNAVGKLDLC